MKLPHILVDGYCYFITTTTERRKALFMDTNNAEILINIIYNQRKKEKFYLLGFVVMPEHMHLMIVPRKDNHISYIMQEIKKGSARLINRQLCRRGKVWMEEYYDSVIRGERDFTKRMNYMANNPVKRRLVERAEDYLYGSVNPGYGTDIEVFFSGSGTTPNTTSISGSETTPITRT